MNTDQKDPIQAQRDEILLNLEKRITKKNLARLLNEMDNVGLTESDIFHVLIEGDPFTSEPVVVIVLEDTAYDAWDATYWPVLSDNGYLHSVIYGLDDFQEYYPNDYSELVLHEQA